MAQVITTNTPAVASVGTELYYAEVENGALTQVFGVQSVPVIDTPREDVTYRTLESPNEFAVPGVAPYESIEIETIYYKSQFTALREKAGTELWWYVKLPDESGGTTSGAKPMVVKWKGAMTVNLSEIALDDMVKSTMKIYKSTVPEIIDGLPSAPAGE